MLSMSSICHFSVLSLVKSACKVDVQCFELDFAKQIGCQLMIFSALSPERQPIFHKNVYLCIIYSLS